ncbi:MAG: hypothetical protein GX556_16510 [Fibrobacter sp.]|nr:hypothetical protein [Fibrobacter sp.]
MIRTIPESGWIPVFTAGEHTDMFSRKRNWTESDLDTIIKNSDPAINDAPAVFGHPEMSSPRYGTVSELKRFGKLLCVKFKDVAADFADAVNKKLYPDRSVGIDKNMRLTHVGFLGAHAPAIEGLPPATFAAPDQETSVYQFAAPEMNLISRIFRRLRDFFIEKYDTDTADKFISQWDLDYLNELNNSSNETVSAFADGNEEGNMDIVQLQAKLAEKETQLAQFAAEKTSQSQEITTLKAEIENLKGQLGIQLFASRKKDFETFVDGLIDGGKVAPAIRGDLVDCLEIMHGAGEYKFASAGENTKKPAVEVFKTVLSSFPKQVTFGEHATKGKQSAGTSEIEMQFGASVDPDRMQIHTRAVEIQTAEKISYEDALKKAMK